ncbi:MAG: hypothetical protein ACKPKO_60275, partial [Candidatus Fonsibacter sp.]
VQVPVVARSAPMAGLRQQAEYVRQDPQKREGLPCQSVAQGQTTVALDFQIVAAQWLRPT